MSGGEFADELAALGWRQTWFADYAGYGQRTVRDYIAGSPSGHAVRLLELLRRLHVPAPAEEGASLETAREHVAPVMRPMFEEAAAQGWPKELLADLLAEIARELKVEARGERKAKRAESKRAPAKRRSPPKAIRGSDFDTPSKNN